VNISQPKLRSEKFNDDDDDNNNNKGQTYRVRKQGRKNEQKSLHLSS